MVTVSFHDTLIQQNHIPVHRLTFRYNTGNPESVAELLSLVIIHPSSLRSCGVWNRSEIMTLLQRVVTILTIIAGLARSMLGTDQEENNSRAWRTP